MSVRFRWRLAVAAALAAPMFTGVVSAHAAAARLSGPQRVVLTSRTTLVGTHAGGLAVYLPRATTINLLAPAGGGLSSTTTTVTGNGRFVGFELRQDGPGPTYAVSAIRAGQCTNPGCQPKFSVADTGIRVAGSSKLFTSTTLPAGNYHLYFIADGAPARVTLPAMPGLGGRPQTLSHFLPAPIQIRAATPTVQLPAPGSGPAGGPVAFAAGTTWTATGWEGSAVLDLWADQPLPNEVVADDVCSYPQPPTGPGAYTYPCPGAGFIGAVGLSSSNQAGPGTGPAGLFGDYVAFQVVGVGGPPGSMSIGGGLTSAGPVTDAHLNELWMDWRPGT